MTRSERRAAMRLNQKNHSPATAPAPPAIACTTKTAAVVAEPPAVKPISPEQLAANQANAKLSTGPKTEIGRAISSMNAVKTGLTSRAVLIAPEDVAIYQTHIARFVKKYSPVAPEESELVQTIADNEWRRLRIVPLEMGIYALGRREFADSFDDIEDLTARKAMIDAAVHMAYRKDLNNLALQERRLRNQIETDIAAFKALQRERLAKVQSELEEEASAGTEVKLAAAENGFVFSTPEMAAAASSQTVQNTSNLEPNFTQTPEKEAA